MPSFLILLWIGILGGIGWFDLFGYSIGMSIHRHTMHSYWLNEFHAEKSLALRSMAWTYRHEDVRLKKAATAMADRHLDSMQDAVEMVEEYGRHGQR